MRDYLKLHFVVLAWGFTAILGRLIQLPAVEVVFFRTLLATGGLWLLSRVLGVRLGVGRGRAVGLAATGLLIGLHWVLFFWAVKVSTASVGLAGMPTTTLWCALIEPLMVRGRKIRWYEVVVGVVTTGALWLILECEYRHVLGLVLSVASAFVGCVFAVLNGQWARQEHFAVISFYEMAGGCAVSLAALPFFGSFKPPTPADLGWLIVLAFGCTVYAYAAYIELLRRLSVFTINIAYNLEPVYGMVLAALIFAEARELSPGFYAGVAIIVASVMVVPILQRQEKLRTPAS